MLEKLILTSQRDTPEVEHRIVSLRTLGAVGSRLVAAGVSVEALDINGPISLMRRWHHLVELIASTPRRTVVQTWLYHGDLLGGLAARQAKRRVAWNIRLAWNIRHVGMDRNGLRPATRAVARLCGLLSRKVPDLILCNAHAAIDSHRPFFYDTDRFIVVPNGFDTTKFCRDGRHRAEVRSAWGFSGDDLVIGAVGRLNIQKDYPTFIRAAALAAQDLPSLRFVIVGRDVKGSAAIRNAIETAGMKSHFALDGERADIPKVMNALDLFCLSSRFEGFPNVLGEAMACETPAVSTDAGDARVLLGDDSRIARVGDPRDLATLMLRVAKLSVEQREALGRRQRDRIEERYGIAAIWRQYLVMYMRLLDEPVTARH